MVRGPCHVYYCRCHLPCRVNSSFWDLIVSKDTFEHAADVASLLKGIGRLLKRDGVAYIGFSQTIL